MFPVAEALVTGARRELSCPIRQHRSRKVLYDYDDRAP